MDKFLDTLFQKRGSAREAALASISEGFKANYQHKFTEKNFATVLYRCLNSFKKGSLKESYLAAHVLGLLAITIGCGENAHELYDESLTPLSQALKSGSDAVKLTSVLDCLAIVTFVGGRDSDETERSMQIIWKFIHSETETSVIARKHSAAVRSAAISAWSLLLTTIDGWTLNYHYWQGAITCFLDFLEANEESVGVAADEALTLIIELGCLDKFAGDGYSSMQEVKEKILSRGMSMCDSKWEFMKVLEDDCCYETSVKIGKQKLKLYTWSQFLQVKFLKRLLGNGFVRHMHENVFLHDVFDFTPKTQQSGNEPYVSEREEVTVRFFVPDVRKKDCKERIYKSHNSVYCKARTQLLNKQRVIRGKELMYDLQYEERS